MPKTRTIRKIDKDPKIKVGSSPASASAAVDYAPPAPPTYDAPENVALTTAIAASTAAPTARIAATWDPPPGATVQDYIVQVSESSSFVAGTTLTFYVQVDSITIEGLKIGTLYYFRVAARSQGYQGPYTSMSPLVDNVNRITTAQDTVAAGVPTAITATWIGYGDLLVTWTNPTEANLKDVQVVVRASSGGTIYRTAYSAAQRFLYTLALNLADTAGAGDSSLYVELKSRTFSNVLGTTVNTGLVTKAAPGTPAGLTQSWSGDTDHNGVAGADWTLNWTRADDSYYYRVQIDSINHYVGGQRSTYTYALDLNTNEHSGTPDPILSYSLFAVDGFSQSSTAASGTATNEDPPTPTVTLTQGFSILIATVGGISAADFAAYEYVFKRDGTTARTLESKAAEQQYELSAAADDGYHSWTCVVRQKDLFGLYSNTVTSSAVAFEALTLAGLRGRISYSDSIATAPATLKTAMSDDVRSSGGVSYAA